MYTWTMAKSVVYNHWTGTVDWNGGMEWCNGKLSKNGVKGVNYST